MKPEKASHATREELIAENNRLEHHLAWLERQIFGTKSERFIPGNDQQTMLDFGTGVSPVPPPPPPQKISYERSAAKTEKESEGHGRGPMPAHLPIVDERIEPEDKLEGSVCIGEETSWRFEYKPGSLYIKRTIRPKYVLPGQDGVTIAQLPPAPVEKGNAGPSLIAHVTQSKYEFHIPLDRQRKMIAQQSGVLLAESVMCDIIKAGCFWIEPVYLGMVDHIKKCRYLQADETPIPVLCKDRKGKTHRGYYWVFYDPLGKVVVFVYHKSRGGDVPKTFLTGFKGILQVDGYEAYNAVCSQPGITRAACMDHVRRYFERARDSQPDDAEYALSIIGSWYEIERDSRKSNLDAAKCLARRKEFIAPSMEQFQVWLKERAMNALPKSPMGEAVGYALGQWPHFQPFLNNGDVQLSNCLIENSIRPVAIGRNNYMFKGSHDAAQRGAMIYSIIGTAKRHDIDRFEYLTDLFTRLPASTNRQIEPFLLHNWKSPKDNSS